MVRTKLPVRGLACCGMLNSLILIMMLHGNAFSSSFFHSNHSASNKQPPIQVGFCPHHSTMASSQVLPIINSALGNAHIAQYLVHA